MKRLLLAMVLLSGCLSTAQTRQQVLEKVVACTKTSATQELQTEAVTCLLKATNDNYASCLAPLVTEWTEDTIQCVAGYFESQLDSGVKG